MPVTTTTTFRLERVERVRRRAGKACRLKPEGPQGWTKSQADPMKLLSVFPSLRLKQGLVLRAYQFREGGNGNGIVWAMPEASAFPEPDECDRLQDRFLGPPRPAEALDDVMEGLEGDGSRWSYLSASLFEREVADFGAMWHGIDWGTHVILGDDPWSLSRLLSPGSPFEGPSGGREDWEWLEPKPSRWEPEVWSGADAVVVTLHTYSGLGREVIYRHTDTYMPGRYHFRSDRKALAEGPGGFVF